ncbi:hypothetical protein GIB67_034379 [Kingdonia uniflora]|uniref:5'-nucleotidase n=1 Tax=Kingdonia uniflora TaxID=39325 RepID=A0A7J7NS02_9MAGN|nr:hypothetical protein GIB67_034379 [Kingdonia uniflora]
MGGEEEEGIERNSCSSDYGLRNICIGAAAFRGDEEEAMMSYWRRGDREKLLEEIGVCCCRNVHKVRFQIERPMSVIASSEVVVDDFELLETKKSAIRNAGTGKLQVIADFDATLTRYWINGRRGQSSHGLLQQGNSEYDVKRQELYDYYHPLEFSPTLPIEDKTKLMEEWWEKTHGLLIEGGLTYDAIESSVASATIAFREGVVELFEFLEERGVPVLIFSAGLADIIEEVLRHKLHRAFKNVKIVSNRMVFNSDGRLVSFKGILLHILYIHLPPVGPTSS